MAKAAAMTGNPTAAAMRGQGQTWSWLLKKGPNPSLKAPPTVLSRNPQMEPKIKIPMGKG